MISIHGDALITLPGTRRRINDPSYVPGTEEVLVNVRKIKAVKNGLSTISQSIKVRFRPNMGLIVADIYQGVVIAAEVTEDDEVYRIHTFKISFEDNEILVKRDMFEIDVGSDRLIDTIKMVLGQFGRLVINAGHNIWVYDWINGTLQSRMTIPGHPELPEHIAFVGPDLLVALARCEAATSPEPEQDYEDVVEIESDFLVIYDLSHISESQRNPSLPCLFLWCPTEEGDAPAHIREKLKPQYRNTLIFGEVYFTQDGAGKSDILHMLVERRHKSLDVGWGDVFGLSISLPEPSIRELISIQADLSIPENGEGNRLYVDGHFVLELREWISKTHCYLINDAPSREEQLGNGSKLIVCDYIPNSLAEEDRWPEDGVGDFVQDIEKIERSGDEAMKVHVLDIAKRERGEDEEEEEDFSKNPIMPPISMVPSRYRITLRDYNEHLLRIPSPNSPTSTEIDIPTRADILKYMERLRPFKYDVTIVKPSDDQNGFKQYEGFLEIPQNSPGNAVFFAGDRLFFEHVDGWVSVLEFGA